MCSSMLSRNSLRSKRFQSSYYAKVRAEAKKRLDEPREETLATQASHESSSYILSSIVHTANIVIRECVSGCLQEVRNNGKSLAVGPKKWSRSLTGGGRLLEAPTVRHWQGKFWCFGLAVAYGCYGRWSLRIGGRTTGGPSSVCESFILRNLKWPWI